MDEYLAGIIDKLPINEFYCKLCDEYHNDPFTHLMEEHTNDEAIACIIDIMSIWDSYTIKMMKIHKWTSDVPSSNTCHVICDRIVHKKFVTTINDKVTCEECKKNEREKIQSHSAAVKHFAP